MAVGKAMAKAPQELIGRHPEPVTRTCGPDQQLPTHNHTAGPLLGNPLSSILNHFNSRNKTDRYKLYSDEVLLTFPVGQNDIGKLATRWFYQ